MMARQSVKQHVLRVIAAHDGEWYWYQVDRAISGRCPECVGPFFDEIDELAAEALIEVRSRPDLPGGVRYWLTPAGQAATEPGGFAESEETIRAMRDHLVDTILGCIAGGAIGDAAGAAFEGAVVDAGPQVLVSRDWHLTDDTQLTLATCEALIESDTPSPERIAASFLRWFRAGQLTGLGASTLKALRDLEVGAHWALAGRKGERAAGNGAAMRIAPLAFCVDPLTDEARRLIRDVSRITHHSDEAYAGAYAVVLAVWAATRGGQPLEWIASHLPDTLVRDRLLRYAALPAYTTVAAAARLYGASGYVIESVPLALFAATQVRLGLTAMLEQVIAAGGDTDTNASLAGQVAGTAIGFSGLPQGLLEKLPQAKLVSGIARDFAESIASRAEP